MQKLETLEQFNYWLILLIGRLEETGRGGEAYAKMQYVTGLRAEEVLTFSRWQKTGPETMQVQLAKREDVRQFSIAQLPAEWLAAYESQAQFYEYNYKSYEYDIRQAGISFMFNGDKRATTTHAFRYYRFRALYEQTGSVAEVQEIMHHVSRGSTMYYLLDSVYVQDRQRG